MRVNSYNTVTHVTYRYQNRKFYRCSTNTSDISDVQQNTGSYPPNSLENFWNRKKMYKAWSIEPATIRKFESIVIMWELFHWATRCRHCQATLFAQSYERDGGQLANSRDEYTSLPVLTNPREDYPSLTIIASNPWDKPMTDHYPKPSPPSKATLSLAYLSPLSWYVWVLMVL